ncbi:uncharacterized protein LOC128222596 isoform X2 [Mya arenaria]|uniref:uncharacterized protein LOC128221016 isoform X2 n=1 Tax=Mya arenaria TaxID=6604 RepID=UPI0022E31948|nr:uncharacterized protein LOC128221016 isoform X2 [Mya arenaria]XP_052787652.1 uncharacterized protein LOC128222596 isoform X2 [Mya arenaria]
MPRIRARKIATTVVVLVMCFLMISNIKDAISVQSNMDHGESSSNYQIYELQPQQGEQKKQKHQQQQKQQHQKQQGLNVNTLLADDSESAKDDILKTCKITHNCSEWFANSLEDNLRTISMYPRSNLSDFSELEAPQKNDTSFPVIVTSASRGFFGSMQGLLRSVYDFVVPKYQDVQVVVYDMGLTTDQVAQEALKEFSWVWWMDSSARIKTTDIDPALQYSIDNSILFFTYGQILNVARHTDVRTMLYLNEDTCKYRYFGEIEAGFVLFHFDGVTKTIVDSWCACALTEQCISPPGAKLSCNSHEHKDGECHRFDQSVLSIILRRLFHHCNDYPLVREPLRIHDIRRGKSIRFFPD